VKNINTKSVYTKISKKRIGVLIGLFVILILSMLLAITLGVARISITDVFSILFNKALGLSNEKYSAFTTGVIFNLRLPRIILSVITGLALGSSGVVMQSLLRNPLASPYTLGISSASAFGAGLIVILGGAFFGGKILNHASWAIVLGSFLMALLAIFIINLIASIKGGGASMLILAGVALSYLFSSGTSFIKYISDHEQLREFTVWLMGGIYLAEWIDVVILIPILIIGLALLLRLAWDINTLNAGEEVAKNLGVDVRKLRRRGSIIAALLTSTVVAFTGIIGFIGLVAPHISRMVVGNDNRFLIITSGMVGAIFLLVADTIARIIISPTELPVGIITSLVGAPFFLHMLFKKRKSYWV